MKQLIALLFILPQFASASKIIGNGGDFYSIQFVNVAQTLLDLLKDHEVTETSLADLQRAVDTTKVESTTKKLFLKGVPKDAINYPQERRILFNRGHWLYHADYWARAQMVVHEFLGVIGVDDSNYRISTALLKKVKPTTGKSVFETFVNKQPSPAQAKQLFSIFEKFRKPKDDGFGGQLMEISYLYCQTLSDGVGELHYQCDLDVYQDEVPVSFTGESYANPFFSILMLNGAPVIQGPGFSAIELTGLNCLKTRKGVQCQF